MNFIKHLSVLFFFCCLFLQPVLAQSSPEVNTAESPFFKDIIGQFHFIEGRLISLFEAVPEEKYSWRPAEGIRSISEVYVHAGGANYFILSFLGAEMPEGFSQDYEKTVTKKAEIIQVLKDGFEFARNFISTIKEEDLDKEVELPFGKFNERSVLLLLLNHAHEHLGQSIAYARTNGVTPPWSQGE